MALAADALTTLEVVLDELGLEADGGRQDARLERYINAASALVAGYCRRSFHRADGVVEALKGFGGVRLFVARTPLLAIDSVVVNGATLGAADYDIEDAALGIIYRQSGWPWTAELQRGPTFHPAPGTEEASIVVTYDGGYVTRAQAADGGAFEGQTITLPADLEDAVVELVTSRYARRGVDGRIVTQGQEQTSVSFGGAVIPPFILGILERYARVSSA